jgi:hypothetical protein
VTVLRTLNFQKYLEKIASTIRTMDEALQALPTVSNEPDENDSEQ